MAQAARAYLKDDASLAQYVGGIPLADREKARCGSRGGGGTVSQERAVEVQRPVSKAVERIVEVPQAVIARAAGPLEQTSVFTLSLSARPLRPRLTSRARVFVRRLWSREASQHDNRGWRFSFRSSIIWTTVAVISRSETGDAADLASVGQVSAMSLARGPCESCAAHPAESSVAGNWFNMLRC